MKIIKDWPSYLQAICAALLVIITGCYTNYARRQAASMEAAVTAANEQTKASLEALRIARAANVVTIQTTQAYLGGFKTFVIPTRRWVGWAAVNTGKITAGRVSWIATLTVVDVVSGQRRQITTNQSSAPRDLQPAGSVDWTFDLATGINPSLERDYAKVDVVLRYDNGFGNSETGSFCRVLVTDESVNGAGKPLFLNDSLPCDKAQSEIERRRQHILGSATRR